MAEDVMNALLGTAIERRALARLRCQFTPSALLAEFSTAESNANAGFRESF